MTPARRSIPNWRRRAVIPGLAVVVVASALGTIYSSHLCREYYARLQALETARWALEEDYSRLLLEQSTLASPHRVATIARDNLGMVEPELDSARVLELQGGAL